MNRKKLHVGNCQVKGCPEQGVDERYEFLYAHGVLLYNDPQRIWVCERHKTAPLDTNMTFFEFSELWKKAMGQTT